MSSLIDDAVRTLRALPDNMQEAAARVILEFASGQEDDQRLRGW